MRQTPPAERGLHADALGPIADELYERSQFFRYARDNKLAGLMTLMLLAEVEKRQAAYREAQLARGPLCGPCCGAADPARAVNTWRATPADPADADPTDLDEHRCRACGRSFWT